MLRFSNHIFAYYDLLLPIASGEITKRLQMWLNNPLVESDKYHKSIIYIYICLPNPYSFITIYTKDVGQEFHPKQGLLEGQVEVELSSQGSCSSYQSG